MGMHKKASNTRTPFDMLFSIAYYATLAAIAEVYGPETELGVLFREWASDYMNTIEA